MDAEQITNIWNQREIPVILRRAGKGELLRLRLPYAETNRSWLQNDRRTLPAWIASKRCWEIPKAWFNDFVERALATFGAVYVIQPYREQEKYSPACLNAVGHECQCSCMGRNHGSGKRKLVRDFRDVRHAMGRSDARLPAYEGAGERQMIFDLRAAETEPFGI